MTDPAEPEHACAILVDPRGFLALQLRPAHLRHAPSQLCCFGGKREEGESFNDCLHRELAEELGWQSSGDFLPAVDLRQGRRWIARFAVGHLPDSAALSVEVGSVLVRTPVPSLPGLPLSPWHARVLTAWQRGIEVVDLADETG